MGGYIDPIFTGLAPEIYKDLKRKAYEKWVNLGGSPLLIFFDERATYDEVALPREGDRMGRFAHVLVQNLGPVTLTACAGELMSIMERTGDDRYVPVQGYKRTLRLTWANQLQGEPPEIDLEPGEIRRLDVCYAVQGEQAFRFAVPRGPHGIQTDYGPGIYKARIRVTGSPAESAYGVFLVIHTGEWRRLRIMDDVVAGPPLPIADFTAIAEASKAFRRTVVQSLGSDNAAWGPAARSDAGRTGEGGS